MKTQPKSIYLADDEINICNIIESFLKKEGYDVTTFHNGRDLYEAFQKKEPDLLVLDIMMPEMDGYSLCSAIRDTSTIPIIIVSARDSETDRIAGLTLGSDDYMTKPFSPMELLARVKSIFRRIEMDSKEDSIGPMSVKDLELNPQARRALVSGKELNLTTMEFNLLYYLIENKNRAVGRDELLNRVWGFESEAETRATDDMVKRLRSKLQDIGSQLKIETVWGFGFIIRDEAD